MNVYPDPRQLKTQVSLSILNAPESGFFSGDYTASTATKSQDNLNTLEYDFPTNYTYADGSSETKYSRRLKVVSGLQNARIPEVNTAISASSCTFAFGGIAPGETDPVLDRLKGPTLNYSPLFVDNPIQGSISSSKESFNDNTQHTPKIPFVDIGNILTTYNIWHLVNGKSEAYKYIGPATSGANTGTLRTIKDPVSGAQVEFTSEKTNTVIKRIFPAAYDAVYQSGAEVHNPDGSRESILARGNNGNNSFHINFSASNLQQNTSAIKIGVEPQVPNNNYFNNFYIEFKIDSKPVIYLYDPDTSNYNIITDIIAPVLDKTNMNSYDLYVHFVGPILMIGFSSDVSRWNVISSNAGREFFCPPDTNIFISLSNANLKFRYSALIFNNFNNNQPVNFKKNYIVAEFKYSQTKIPDNKIPDFIKTIKTSFEASSYRINGAPRNTGYNSTNPLDKNISYFADLRLPAQDASKKAFPQFQEPVPYRFSAFTSADKDKKTLYIKLFYNTTIEGPAFMQIEIPHPGVLTSAGVGNFTDASTGAGSQDYKFVNPSLNTLFYEVGDITSWVQSWSVNCQAQLSNMSKISKTATITLKNIDTEFGQKYINAIENNLLVVSIDAGYVQGSLYPYFQGFITSTSYTRSGNDSTFTLTCEDIASFVLDNIYFDKNMLIAGMRHDLAIDSIMAASGFWSYYSRNNFDADNGSLVGMNLRLNSNSVNNQDLIKINPLDKIYEKLGRLLERLNDPSSLPTFRWVERKGLFLECRNNYIDTDLKFTGLDANGTQYIFNSNASNQTNFLANYQSDLHGLLTGDYTINTDMKTLSAGLRVFGLAMTGFLASERYFPKSTTVNNLDLNILKDLLGYLSNAPFDATQDPYVGFKKYLMHSMQRNEIPDQEILERITNSLAKVVRTPVSKISFNCYVAKPLSFHGKFFINVLSVNSTSPTDKYIYESVDYSYDKNNNLITARVSGINIPILIKDIK